MNQQRAQVFIATTQGLVQVQSIVRLNEASMHSVVTVGNTSQLAGISSDYQNFIAKPQGIIANLFGGNAYRLNLSKGIDQGESWQLGVFLAHYLFEYDCLSDGSQQSSSHVKEPCKNDIIFIATGRVDTLHYRILPIDELAKKCLHANPHIANWQSKKQQICFLAPSQNFRKPIPNTLMKLTPIAQLAELFTLCNLFDLATREIIFEDSINISTNERIENTSNIDKYSAVEIIDAKLVASSASTSIYTDNTLSNKTYINDFDDKQQSVEQETISNSVVQTAIAGVIRRIPLILYLVIATTFVWSLVSLLGSFTSSNEQNIIQGNKSNVIKTSAQYAIVGSISQNRVNCLLADKILISKGGFAVNIHSNTTNLNNLCDLFVVTSQQIMDLWLVSDTKAIIKINMIEFDRHKDNTNDLDLSKYLSNDNENLNQWVIPLPKNKSQTRHFTLLAFSQSPDEADFRSLQKYLFQLYQQGKSHNMSDLQGWISKTQSNNEVFMLTQELTIYR